MLTGNAARVIAKCSNSNFLLLTSLSSTRTVMLSLQSSLIRRHVFVSSEIINDEMSARKNSTAVCNSSDSDDTNIDSVLNRAIRTSHGEQLSETRTSITNESVSITRKQDSQLKYELSSCSVERSISTVTSTSILFSLRDRKRRQLADENDRYNESNEQNRTEITSIAVKTDLNVKGPKPRITGDEILLEPIRAVSTRNLNTDLCENLNEENKITNSSNDRCKKLEFQLPVPKSYDALQLSPGSDKSDNAWETQEVFNVDNLDESNIWPALTALETTFSKADVNTSKDHRAIIDKLSEQFNYCPRSFTETLLTIIEESFAEPDDTSEGFRKIFNAAEGIKLLEDESAPKIFVTRPSEDFTDFSHTPKANIRGFESAGESTKYMSLESGDRTRKLQETPESSPSENKAYRKTPRIVLKRETPKIAVAHRLRIGSASSIGQSPRKHKNFSKTPKIVIDPGTPQSPRGRRKGHELPIKSCDDDEYLTAESDTEDSKECTAKSREPAASSSEKFDISRLAVCHEEWTQAFKKVSKYKPLSYRKTLTIAEREQRLLNHEKKLEKRWMREMQQKRQKCIDLVQRLMEKDGCKGPTLVEEKSVGPISTCEITKAFFKILYACSEYFAYGMNGKETFDTTAKTRRFVTSTMMNLKEKSQNPSSRSPVHSRSKKSLRRSLSKRIINVESSGAKWLSPKSKAVPKAVKRRSLKGSGSPKIDSTSIRPVAQLRSIFSPTLQAADGSGFTKRSVNFTRSAEKSTTYARSKKFTSKSIVPVRSLDKRKTPDVGRTKSPRDESKKFKNVVSPIGKYIRGEN